MFAFVGVLLVLLIRILSNEVLEILKVRVFDALRHGRWSEHVDRNGTLPMQLEVFENLLHKV